MALSTISKALSIISANKNCARLIATSTCSSLRRKKAIFNPSKTGQGTKFISEPVDHEAALLDDIEDYINETKLQVDTTEVDPVERKNPREQAIHHRYESENREKDTLILFPGFGNQYVGMCSKTKDLMTVKLFQEASEILGYDLLDICENGPAEKLSSIKIQEVATFVASIAAARKLERCNPEAIYNCVGTAGFSVGQITALHFAGALSFESALRIIEVRGDAMEVASHMNPGGMLYVETEHKSKLNLACQFACRIDRTMTKGSDRISDCKVSARLHPDLRLVSGNVEALSFLANNQEKFKIKVKKLNIPIAMHCKLMEPTKPMVYEAVRSVHIQTPKIPVFTPYKKMIDNSKDVIKEICSQLHHPVKWESLLHQVYSRVQGTEFPSTYECGPGTFMSTVLGKVNLKAAAVTTNIEA